jgi:hypothetical protein
MTIRPFTIFDLLTLGNYSRNILTLDSSRAVTRGNLLGLTALFPFFNPGQFLFTAIQENNLVSVMGQVTLMEHEACARISFLAPGNAIDEDETPIIEHLVMQAGDWGALYVMAELDERSPAFKSLRKAGFAMYAWQKVWKLTDLGGSSPDVQWEIPDATEMLTVQGLYTQIVPALLQPVDSMPRMGGGLICAYDGKIQMYAAITSGPAGIWVQPLVHPDAACAADCLQALLYAIPNRGGKPVYICIRSYQAWLETTLEELGAEPSPQQAVMVKHLAAMLRDEAKVNLPEKAFVKPAAPITRSSTEK